MSRPRSRLPAAELHVFLGLRDGVVCHRADGRPVAQNAMARGYMRTTFRGQSYLMHRLVWLLHTGNWPAHNIDHINGDPADNRIENLRDVPQSVNMRNRRRNLNNRSGVSGVYWYPCRNKWRAVLHVDGKTRCLGDFLSKEQAAEARRNAEAAHGYTGRSTRIAA